jgi:hypothetical protein
MVAVTGACPRCGAPWSGEVSCRQCGLLLGTPPPPPPSPHLYPYPPPPPPPPPPPAPEDRPDVWARRGGLASLVLCVGLFVLGGLGMMLVTGSSSPSPTATAILAGWLVLAVVGIVEGARAWRGNLGAAIRAGIVDAIFGAFLLWIGSVTFIGGERMWGERDHGLKDMVSLLGFIALVAAAEAIIGALVAKKR